MMKKEIPLPIRLYNEYLDRFSNYSDEEIIDCFNHEVGQGGWGTARASYLGALHEQLNIRKIDYSEIGDTQRLSLKRKVKLEGKKIKVIPNSEPTELKGGLFKVDFDENSKDGYKLTPYDKRSKLF